MSAKNKILIVGGSGYIGSAIARSLAGKYEVVCTHRKDFTPIDQVEFFRFSEISDKDQCKALMQKFEPTHVIYATGSNSMEQSEKDMKLTQHLHTNGASMMLTASDYIKAKFIYLSSDWVFSGIEGNYSESDTAIPYTQIGKAKLSAENYVRNRSSNHIIIRSSFLLGRGTLDHPSWLDVLRENQIQGKKTALPQKNFHNPVHLNVLLNMIQKSLDPDLKNKTFHLGGLTKISLYDLAIKFLKKYDYDPALVEVSDGSSHSSPSDFSLNFTQTIRSLKIETLLLEQSLDLLK